MASYYKIVCLHGATNLLCATSEYGDPLLVCNCVINMLYESPDFANQNSRKLSVFDRKLKGSHLH